MACEEKVCWIKEYTFVSVTVEKIADRSPDKFSQDGQDEAKRVLEGVARSALGKIESGCGDDDCKCHKVFSFPPTEVTSDISHEGMVGGALTKVEGKMIRSLTLSLGSCERKKWY
jgi:hypothetical protein